VTVADDTNYTLGAREWVSEPFHLCNVSVTPASSFPAVAALSIFDDGLCSFGVLA
jgi:hypothetical protein